MDPVGADVHEVHVRILAQRLVGLLLPAVQVGRQALSGKEINALPGTVGLDVADGGDVATGNEREALDGTAAAHSQPYDPDADILNGVGGKLQHVGLGGFARRNRQGDDGWSDGTFTAGGQQQCCGKKKKFGTHIRV